MAPDRVLSAVTAVAVLSAGAMLLALPAPIAAPIERTVYVTVVDNKGAFVPDITAADLVVKEGGKERAIVKIEPSVEPLNIALLIEQGLTGDSYLRNGIFQFLQRVNTRARTALFVVNRRAVMVQDYTSDLQAQVAAINGFGLTRPTQDENLTEAVFETARNLQRIETGRRVIVALALENAQESAMSADQALDELQQSGVMFYAATMAGGRPVATTAAAALDESSRGKILGDGTKQTGGRRQESLRTAGFPAVLTQFADELLHQYAVTYVLPDGVKKDSRLSVSTKRKGVSIRAASRIPK